MLRTVYQIGTNASYSLASEVPAPSDMLLLRIAGSSGIPPQMLRAAITGNAKADTGLCLAMKALYDAASKLPARDAEQLVPALLSWRPGP
jgi:hypothetical protein